MHVHALNWPDDSLENESNFLCCAVLTKMGGSLLQFSPVCTKDDCLLTCPL